MELSLNQASKECGKAKSTISKAIKTGRLSADKQKNGTYKIDTAELFRVFPKQQVTSNNDQLRTPSEPHKNELLQAKIDALEAKVDMLQDNVADLKEDREDLKTQRDKWQHQATNLLPDHSQREQNTARGGFFGLFQGKHTPKE